MEVRPGYEQAEVGVIPQEWAVASLSLFADVKTGPFGTALHESDYVNDGTPIITVEHLGERGVVHENLPYVSDADWNRLRAYLLQPGDIVFSRVGSVDRNALIRDVEGGWLFSGRLLRVRTRKGNVYPPYLSFYFHSEPFKHRVRAVAVGQTMASLNTQILKGLLVVLPPFPEQRAIAMALSDVDALLGGLDQVIAKKRDLKQAAMQQLLTGKGRLPGFHREWELRKFSDLLTFERPDRYLIKSTDYEGGGDTPVLTANKSFILGHTNEKFGICESLPVIIFDDFTTDSKYVDFPFKVKSSAIKILRSRRPEVNLRFVAERMRLVSFPGGEHKRYYISEYQHIELPTPSPEEQCAIAAVLSDMDAELNVLDARRDKVRDLKQAMMQDLLTGKTRLIPARGANA